MGRSFVTGLLLVGFGAVALYVGLRGHTVSLFGALLVLLAIGAAYLWNRFVFSKLTLERSLNRRRGDFGTPITMRLTLTNRKLLPLFGLKVQHKISSGLLWDDARHLVDVSEGSANVFQDFFHLNWYEKRSRTYELRATRRGRFEFGTGLLSYSDPFGFFTNAKEDVFCETHLVVFPRVVPIQGVESLNTYLFGTKPKEGWIFVDPLNYIGTRAYQSTDSARMINWKATARHIEAQVNIEKPSFDQQVYIVLEQQPDVAWWTSAISNNLELAIMASASLIDSYCQAGYEIRLATNLVSKVHGTGQLPSQAARGRGQRDQLLTNLALLQNFSVDPISKIMAMRMNQIKPGSTVVIITTAESEFDSSFAQMVRGLMRKSKVAVVRVLRDGTHVRREEGLKEWRIEGEVPWDEVAKLELC